MKTSYFYIGILAVPMIVLLLLTSASNAPQRMIVGEWVELNWEYEGENLGGISDTEYEKRAADIRNAIGQNLVIHRAETWQFSPDGRLSLFKNGSERIVKWHLKGRGHILQLKYDNGTTENYSINKLGRDTMEIHFETDMQARGIAKLLFIKTDSKDISL
jgi:hypothetical protein